MGITLATNQKIDPDKFTKIQLSQLNNTVLVNIARKYPDSAVVVYIYIGRIVAEEYANFDKMVLLSAPSPPGQNARSSRSIHHYRRQQHRVLPGRSPWHNRHRNSSRRFSGNNPKGRQKRQLQQMPKYNPRPVVFDATINVSLYAGTTSSAAINLMNDDLSGFQQLWLYTSR